MRRNWKLFYWKIIKLFSNMLTAFILTSCHKNIVLASFFTPTPIILLMDNVMKFKFFSSIILTNCHMINIKPLNLVNNVNYYFQFISSLLFFQTVFIKFIFIGEKGRGLLYDLRRGFVPCFFVLGHVLRHLCNVLL